MEDDFTTPDGNWKTYNFDTSDTNLNWKQIHDDFANQCKKSLIFYRQILRKNFQLGLVHDKGSEEVGKSLFYHENGRSSNFFHRSDFQPEFNILPEIPENV